MPSSPSTSNDQKVQPTNNPSTNLIRKQTTDTKKSSKHTPSSTDTKPGSYHHPTRPAPSDNNFAITTMISGILICILLSTIDYLSISGSYLTHTFKPENIPEKSPILTFDYTALSRLLFTISAIISMITSNLFTGINYGCYSGSICENIIFTQVLLERTIANVYYKYHSLYPNNNSNENFLNPLVLIVIINTIVAFAISTLLFSLLTSIVYYSNISKILECIPGPLICGFMGGIAFGQFKTCLNTINHNDMPKNIKGLSILGRNISVSILIFTAVVTLTIYVLAKKYPSFNLSLILCVLFFTIITYGIGYSIFRSKYLDTYRTLGYVKTIKTESLMSIWKLFRILGYIKLVDFGIIWSVKWSIINIAVFSMFHLPINYGVYRATIVEYTRATAKEKSTELCEILDTNTDNNIKLGSLSTELRSQYLSNIISAFTSFIPSYLVGSYSAAYFKGGGRTKPTGVLSGFFSIVLPFIGPFLYSYIPVFAVGAVPLYISVCFLKDALGGAWDKTVSLIYNTNIRSFKNTNNVNYNNLSEKDFVSFSSMPHGLIHSDYYDLLISIVVLAFVIMLDDYCIVGLLVGFVLCYLKQTIILYFTLCYNNKEYKKTDIFRRSFGCNFIGRIIYDNKQYRVYKPVTVNFWNLASFSDDKENENDKTNKIYKNEAVLYDLRDAVYIDTVGINKFNEGGEDLIIY
ncbi:hypothetical protein CDIK_2433 [Cucumispora dikerogammari]|nr:hypothetical protein CDIK_2433 [Cucumispora dikerogammari]